MDEEENGRQRTPSPPLPIPSDLPSLDNIEMSERSMNVTKNDQRSRQPLSKVRTEKSRSSLIKDLTVDQKVKIPVSYPLNKVMSARRSPRSFIEFVYDNEGQGSVRSSPGSLIEVLEDHEGQESFNSSTGVDCNVTEGQRSLSRSLGSQVKVTECQGLVSSSEEAYIKVMPGQGSATKSAGAEFKVTESQGLHSESEEADFTVTKGQGSICKPEAEIKVTTGQEGQESAVITYRSSGSVIKVGQQAEGASCRQVAALLREAERQHAEGDLLSASLNYNKVLSLCPQQVEARRALSHLLKGEDPFAEAPARPPSPSAGSAGSVPLVQEVE